MAFISAVGAPMAAEIQNLIRFNIFVFETIRAFFKNFRYGRKLIFRNIAFQILFTAIEAIPVTLLISVFLFSAVVMQVDMFIPRIGAGLFLGNVFVILIVRELAPLVIALVLVARSGTAVAAEISSMIVNDEVNWLRVLGIEPLYFIVVPRIAGITISLMCLSFLFTVFTLVGGMLLSNYYLDISISQYVEGIFNSVTPRDVLINIMKSFVFGLIISSVCCFYGMSTKYSSTEIPQVTTKAVIGSLFWCFVFSAIVTIIYY